MCTSGSQPPHPGKAQTDDVTTPAPAENHTNPSYPDTETLTERGTGSTSAGRENSGNPRHEDKPTRVEDVNKATKSLAEPRANAHDSPGSQRSTSSSSGEDLESGEDSDGNYKPTAYHNEKSTKSTAGAIAHVRLTRSKTRETRQKKHNNRVNSPNSTDEMEWEATEAEPRTAGSGTKDSSPHHRSNGSPDESTETPAPLKSTEVRNNAEDNTSIRALFERVRAFVECPQDGCRAVGMWHIKGACDILCTVCNLRVTRNRFKELISRYEEAPNMETPAQRSTIQANEYLQNANPGGDQLANLEKLCLEQSAQLSQLMAIQTSQQLRIDELTKLVDSQREQIAQLIQSKSVAADSNATATAPCLPPQNTAVEVTHTTACQRREVPNEGRISYRDAIATTSRKTPHASTRSIPWVRVTEKTDFTALSKSQQDAIKRAQKALAPLSRKSRPATQADLEPEALYFGNIRRARYRTVYQSLNKIINRRDLLGISFIGRDIIEVLITKQAVTSTLQKMRFMRWTHLPEFNPEQQDNHAENSNAENMTTSKRIRAMYKRWYDAWSHSRSDTARQWYAAQGNRSATIYEQIFAGEPERRSFEQYKSVEIARMNEATAALRAESRRCPDSPLKWTIVRRTEAPAANETKNSLAEPAPPPSDAPQTVSMEETPMQPEEHAPATAELNPVAATN